MLTENQFLSESWLYDNEINAFIKILRYFHSILALENSARTQHETFRCEKKTESFVRIILSRLDHWVCVVGGFWLENEDVLLYDSMYRNSIDAVLGEQQFELEMRN